MAKAKSEERPSTKAKDTSTYGSSVSTILTLLVVAAAVAVAVASYDPSQLPPQVHRLLHDTGFTAFNGGSSFVCEDAHAYLTDVHPVKGFHVVCIERTPQNTLYLTAFKDGNFKNRSMESVDDLNSVRGNVEQLVDYTPPQDEHGKKHKQPYAFFTPTGDRLSMLGDMTNAIVFMFEGGQFIWPGVRVGHERIVHDVSGRGDVVLKTMSMIPLVFEVEEFLKDEEIDIILEKSMDHLAPSGVAHADGHEGRPATDWRTSSTYFLSSSAHPVIREIDQRTADLTKVPVTHQEDVQVLRYEATQKYDQHLDYFPVDRHQKQKDMLETIQHGYRNRMVTVFWYMSDVEEGGHTVFPRAGGKAKPSKFNDCSHGLKVPPKKRKVIVFYDMLPNGQGDEMSLHGGCPVEKGIKYSGNKWIWNKPYQK